MCSPPVRPLPLRRPLGTVISSLLFIGLGIGFAVSQGANALAPLYAAFDSDAFLLEAESAVRRAITGVAPIVWLAVGAAVLLAVGYRIVTVWAGAAVPPADRLTHSLPPPTIGKPRASAATRRAGAPPVTSTDRGDDAMTTPLLSRATRWSALAAPILTLVLIAACSAPPSDTGPGGTLSVPVKGDSGYTDVRPAALAAMLKAKDFVFVNVHVPYEGEIAETDLFLPYDQVDARLAELPADKDARIVLYCRSGSMSTIAARALVTAGYTDVWNLEGGMNAWRAQGYPLVGH